MMSPELRLIFSQEKQVSDIIMRTMTADGSEETYEIFPNNDRAR